MLLLCRKASCRNNESDILANKSVNYINQLYLMVCGFFKVQKMDKKKLTSYDPAYQHLPKSWQLGLQCFSLPLQRMYGELPIRKYLRKIKRRTTINSLFFALNYIFWLRFNIMITLLTVLYYLCDCDKLYCSCLTSLQQRMYELSKWSRNVLTKTIKLTIKLVAIHSHKPNTNHQKKDKTFFFWRILNKNNSFMINSEIWFISCNFPCLLRE